ncbi:histidine kinase [Polaribacter sp.]|nr:histidine kinase [Polaribacter sp.]MDB4242004.1 histidine kinase [Polaribacter sp.]
MQFINNFITIYYNTKKVNFFLVLGLFYGWNLVSQNNTNEEFVIIKNAPETPITLIKQDQIGHLLMATAQGLFQFDGADFLHYNTKNSLLTNHVNTISIKKDSLFIGTNTHLSIKVRTNFYHYESKKINKIIFHKGVPYIATDEGISYFNKSGIQPVEINTQLDFAKINDISFHQGAFYIASNRGFWKIDQLINPKKIRKITPQTYSTLLQNGTELIAIENTNKIAVFKESKRTQTIQSISNITNVAIIENEIWIASANESIEILEASTYHFKRKINKYNSKLSSNSVTSVSTDRQRNKWISTKNEGLIVYKNAISKAQKPTLFLEDLKVSYQSLDTIDPNSYTQILSLKSKQSTISFQYKTIDLLHPKKIEYRWTLNADSSSWSRANSVLFRDLKPGNYTFSVQARTLGKQLSDPREIRFTIAAPFYKKTWFLLSLCTFFIFLFIAITIRHIRVTKRKNEQKIASLQQKNHLLSLEQKALQLQMNPHFIFNVLNGIKAAGNAGNKSEMNTTINKFATLLRSILNNSRTEEVALNEEINTLKNYIELEQMMHSKSFAYEIKTLLNGIDPEEILIPPMLLQPFLENSIKHGIHPLQKEGFLVLKFEVKSGYLHCSIDDNGVGLQQSSANKKRYKSVAIEVNKARIENLSGENSFTIKELKEKEKTQGTRVWFKIPLKTDY